MRNFLFITYLIPCFSYMFWCIPHHLQGELRFSILKHMLLRSYLWYSGCVVKDTTLLVYNNDATTVSKIIPV